jgi:hypothetical protein
MSLIRQSLLLVTVLLVAGNAAATSAQAPVMWESVEVSRRDLINGPGGTAMKPNLSRITFIERETGGNNRKYRIKDGSGRVWVAKIADESQAETAATRLLWAIGYKTEIDYLIPRLTIPGQGTFQNVRLEARPENVDRDGRWEWKNNPFTGKQHFQGLKLMMALINNWDLKDDNTAVLVRDGQRQYIVSDLGSSFGRTSSNSLPILTRFGRSVNNVSDYSKASFIVGTTDEGHLDLAYDGKQDHLMKEISIADAQWLGRLLGQLSNKQISDAFRAANYSRSDVRTMTNAVKSRIAQLRNPRRTNIARR